MTLALLETATRVTPVVVVLKTLTLILGDAITFLPARAARRTGARSLRALAIGFGVVTLGSLSAGIADFVLAVEAGTALAVESALTEVGFGIILYSLYVQ